MKKPRLALPQVTLCAASSVNVAATIRALETSMATCDFAACKLFTDASVTPSHPDISVIPIAPLTSAADYSYFLLSHMVDYVDTSHCLVTQWDGHVLNAEQWRAEFLDNDYIGASWPQFTDGYDVGNGGFSLRSRRLMEACRDPHFNAFHPEDIAIGRKNRAWLEYIGMRFAPCALADLFSAERAADVSTSFGYHGVWLMPRVIGPDAFWDVYRMLDDHGTIRHNFGVLLHEMRQGQGAGPRVARMIADYLRRTPSRKRIIAP